MTGTTIADRRLDRLRRCLPDRGRQRARGRPAPGSRSMRPPKRWRSRRAGRWQRAPSVNLERSLRVGDELGGHIVTGHVDGVADGRAPRRTAPIWRGLALRAPARNLPRSSPPRARSRSTACRSRSTRWRTTTFPCSDHPAYPRGDHARARCARATASTSRSIMMARYAARLAECASALVCLPRLATT